MNPVRSPRPAAHGAVILPVVAVCLLLGVLVGAGAYTFHYARGGSYLSNDPEACVNCHIMREQYDSWIKSSHRSVATCNDCHIPHTLPGKYLVKAENGFWHSYKVTFQNFHEPIRIRESNARVLQENCLHCHGDMVGEIASHAEPFSITCVRCHGSVGHAQKR